MLKKISFVLTLLIFSTSLIGLAAEIAAAGPQGYLPESIYEFTPVVEGTAVSHEFILQNRGNTPLKILKLDSG